MSGGKYGYPGTEPEVEEDGTWDKCAPVGIRRRCGVDLDWCSWDGAVTGRPSRLGREVVTSDLVSSTGGGSLYLRGQFLD